MKKHNLGRTLVELLIVSVVALMLGLSMFGYKPVHSNAGTMPVGTLITSPILLNPVCIGTGCSNLSTSGTPATGQLAQFTDATHVQGASIPTITTGPPFLVPLISPLQHPATRWQRGFRRHTASSTTARATTWPA